jgi:hypothetical protein
MEKRLPSIRSERRDLAISKSQMGHGITHLESASSLFPKPESGAVIGVVELLVSFFVMAVNSWVWYDAGVRTPHKHKTATRPLDQPSYAWAHCILRGAMIGAKKIGAFLSTTD